MARLSLIEAAREVIRLASVDNEGEIIATAIPAYALKNLRTAMVSHQNIVESLSADNWALRLRAEKFQTAKEKAEGKIQMLRKKLRGRIAKTDGR